EHVVAAAGVAAHVVAGAEPAAAVADPAAAGVDAHVVAAAAVGAVAHVVAAAAVAEPAAVRACLASLPVQRAASAGASSSFRQKIRLRPYRLLSEFHWQFDSCRCF